MLMDKQGLALTNEEALSILAYLLTSAQGCLREPPDYGVFRLLSAAERLSQAWQPKCSGEMAEFLKDISTNTGPASAKRDVDPQGFSNYIAEMCRILAHNIKQLDQEEDRNEP
jgi:hypothetical protein